MKIFDLIDYTLNELFISNQDRELLIQPHFLQQKLNALDQIFNTNSSDELMKSIHLRLPGAGSMTTHNVKETRDKIVSLSSKKWPQ